MFNSFVLLESESVWALGANVTLSGMVIVFLGLILLVVIISVFSLLFDRKKSIKPEPVQQQPVSAGQSVVPAVSPAQQNDSDEIIAVIAAAVDAMYSGSGKKAVIRSVRPSAAAGRPIWASVGIMENTRAF